MSPPAAAPAKTGKLWIWPTLLRDHTRFLAMLPAYLAAYIMPGRALPPKTIEGVMLTMNSYNACPYCTGLHGQLARMAGVEAPDESDPAVGYAKTFAIEAGRGADVDSAFDALAKALGHRKASSVRALCWALLWGKTTGNTINAARDKLLTGSWMSVRLLDLFVLAYYGPLFLVIGVLNKALMCAPSIPKGASAILGAVLWLLQAINIAPLGVASVVLNGGVQ